VRMKASVLSVFETKQMLSGINFPLTRCSFSSKANSITNKKRAYCPLDQTLRDSQRPSTSDCLCLMILIKT